MRSFTPETRVAQHFEPAYPGLAARELRSRPASRALSTAPAVGKREGALTWHTASIRSPAGGPLPEGPAARSGESRIALHHLKLFTCYKLCTAVATTLAQALPAREQL